MVKIIKSQSSRALTNYHRNPLLSTSNLDYNGSNGLFTRVAVTGAYLKFAYGGTVNATASGTRVYSAIRGLTIGNTYSFGMWIQRIGHNHIVYITTDTNVADAITITPSGIGTGWEWITGSFTALAETVYAQNRQAGTATGDVTNFVSGVTAISGSTPPSVALDGATPGWRWTGTAGASTSIGPPYTLESIAGPPLGWATSPGLMALPSTTTTVGLTTFLIADVKNSTGGTSTAYAGVTAGTGFTHNFISGPEQREIRTQVSTGGAQWYMRLPGSNIVTATATGHSVGRHILSVTDDFISGTVTAHADNAPFGNTTITRASLVIDLLDLGDSNVNDTPIAGLVYAKVLNDTTRARVTAWLARKYNVPLA